MLTPEEAKLRADILEAEMRLAQAESRYFALKKSCKHRVKPRSKKGKKRNDNVECEICGVGLGYWCPESPDETCHYKAEGGMIELLDGTKVPVPVDENGEDRGGMVSGDHWCYFCGHPLERP
jgi:hypothetical protein